MTMIRNQNSSQRRKGRSLIGIQSFVVPKFLVYLSGLVTLLFILCGVYIHYSITTMIAPASSNSNSINFFSFFIMNNNHHDRHNNNRLQKHLNMIRQRNQRDAHEVQKQQEEKDDDDNHDTNDDDYDNYIESLVTKNNNSIRYHFELKHDPNDLQTMYHAIDTIRLSNLPLTYLTANDSKSTHNNTTTIHDTHETYDDTYYNIYDCPAVPPKNYPIAWNAVNEVLQNWNPDNTTIPERIYQSLCIFDWRMEHHRAISNTYRQYEVPFIVQYHPDITRTTYRWAMDPNYVDTLLYNKSAQRNEHSSTNHFMYWNQKFYDKLQQKRKQLKQQHRSIVSNDNADDVELNWKPPTDNVYLTFQEWKEKAMAIENEASTNFNTNHSEYWYFRLNGVYPPQQQLEDDDNNKSNQKIKREEFLDKNKEFMNLFLYDELPFFQPKLATKRNERTRMKLKQKPKHVSSASFFMIDPEQERGINCRFGMKGIIAEAHFDPTRNWIVVLKGRRRYILAHPDQCIHLELYPLGHPSGRHSRIDWSNIQNNKESFSDRPFGQARLNEVILQAGDALYLPTSWFHYVVSLNFNYQCNARSGYTTENHHFIQECGFPI